MESPISQLQKIQEQTEHLKQKLDNLKKVREEVINTIMKDENLLRLLISQDYRIEVAMTLTNYSISKAAKMLGISTRTIHRSIANQNKKQGIQ